ncbi:mandelate racemase/muconate lactonizing enzyme family protein [Xanthobacteraceae bacterium Astr-EGSB]|uniref:mandelate racemase/muconate lactonizing enzyme family protein n=1 Tax=Astrobacterium formosum TaxID=3069710 RepID=UPI0027B16B9F|nr:mandelate racemase/muconate lactonizing enzyme family protein [Xanthobacteraceae bacterium Astr-EGSB]
MKIVKARVLHINPIRTAPTQAGQRPILIRIETDEGIYGIGEVGMAYGVGGRAAFGMLQDLAGMIIGLDPMNIESIWEMFLKKTFWGQGGGTVIFGGISGIDMALWDIKGKALGVPVYQLLGGKCRDDLRVYASQIQLAWSPVRKICGRDEEYAEQALIAVAQGYDAIKVDVVEFDREGKAGRQRLEGVMSPDVVRMSAGRVRAIREAVGPDIDIIVENHAHTDLTSAIQLAKAIEEYDIMFYEEPCSSLNPKLYRYAKDKIDIPIAAGERVYSRWGFVPFFESRSIDVAQPDLGTCGGLSEGKKIADMAHAYDITVQAHVAGTPIALAASLHLETAIPNFIIHEHHQKALMREYIDLCRYDYQPIKGRYRAPDLPGLGQDLTDEVYKNADVVDIV